MFKSSFARTNLAVLVPELLIAPPVALGAVYCVANFAPHQLEWLTRIVAKDIVLPHMKFFDSLGGSLRHAHDKHDQEKREEMIRLGLPVPEVEKPSTPQEKAHTVASVLLKGTIALASDLGATILAQKTISKGLDAGLSPKLPYIEFGMHAAGIAALPTMFAVTAENINHKISNKLRDTFGMTKDRAEDISVPYTYVALPGQLAALLALTMAHKFKSNGLTKS